MDFDKKINSLMCKLKGLEKDIKENEKWIRLYENVLAISEDQLQNVYKSTFTHDKARNFIKMYQKLLAEKQDKIQYIIRNNPAIEPHWVMKKICE